MALVGHRPVAAAGAGHVLGHGDRALLVEPGAEVVAAEAQRRHLETAAAERVHVHAPYLPRSASGETNAAGALSLGGSDGDAGRRRRGRRGGRGLGSRSRRRLSAPGGRRVEAAASRPPRRGRRVEAAASRPPRRGRRVESGHRDYTRSTSAALDRPRADRLVHDEGRLGPDPTRRQALSLIQPPVIV